MDSKAEISYYLRKPVSGAIEFHLRKINRENNKEKSLDWPQTHSDPHPGP